jgi:hypothetical protein
LFRIAPLVDTEVTYINYECIVIKDSIIDFMSSL